MSSWKYSNTAPADMSWTIYSQAWPEYTSKPILEIAVYTHQGFILHVNGDEVNRFNLPS